jgi:drug/metabolite transporter (DMT)-like permease
MSTGLILALLATLGWGAGDVFARKAMTHVPASAVVLGMAALIVATLAVAVGLTDGLASLMRLPWYVYALAAVMGFLAHLGGQLLYLWGMQRAGLTIAAPIIGAVPLIAVFLAVVLGGERPSVPTLVGAFVIVGGIILLVTDRNRVLRQ